MCLEPPLIPHSIYCKQSCRHIASSTSCNGECGQFVTDVYGRKLSTNVDLLEKYRYRAATTNVNWRHLVANLSLYKNESMLTMLGFPLTHFSDCQHPSQFVFVTASDRKYYHAALDAIGSLQWFFPNYTIYFYDLSNGSLRRKMARVSVWAITVWPLARYMQLSSCARPSICRRRIKNRKNH